MSADTTTVRSVLDRLAENRIQAASRKLDRHDVERDKLAAERDRLIRAAVAGGAGLREVARAAGLTHQMVRKIIARTNVGCEETP